MIMKRSCKPTPAKTAEKEVHGKPDVVKGIVASSAKRPEMNDPFRTRTESDDEDLDFDDWIPPTKEEEERARASTVAEKTKMDMKRSCKPIPAKTAEKEADGKPDSVKGTVALSVKRPEMSDPACVRTESDDECPDFGDWKSPTTEEEEQE